MALSDTIHKRGLRSAQPAAAANNTGLLYCVTDEGNILERSNGSSWQSYSPAVGTGTGDFVGPASSTDNGAVRFDGITGKLAQNTAGPTFPDTGRISNVVDPSSAQDAATKAYADTDQLTGDVTTSAGAGSQAATIANDAVTNAKAANMAQATIKGRASGAGTGDPTDLTANQTSTILDTATDPFLRTSGASAAGVTQLTGDVTAGPGSGSQAATIATAAVTLAKMADLAAARIIGRASGAGTGVPTALTGTQATVILDAMVGDSGSGGTKGLAPAPGSGDAAAAKFLKADGTWAIPAGGGGGAPDSADYVVETANGSLSAESVLGTTVITTATYASRQAAAKAGRLFLPSDGFYAERDTGAAWASWGPIFPLTPPVLGDFTWVNQGSATTVTTNGGIHLTSPGLSGNNIRALVKTAPGTPYTVTIGFLPLRTMGLNVGMGAIWRQSSDGKLIVAAMSAISSIPAFNVVKYTNATTFSTTVVQLSVMYGPLAFIRIADNGTNRTASFSADGVNFLPMYSETRTTFMTADQIGFFVDAVDPASTYLAAMTLLHFVVA